MKYVLDTHTHTIASGHAYNTITEMVEAAKEKGLEAIAITDHAPKMPGSAGILYFSNMGIIPRQKCGVKIYMGCEVNIMDYDGNIDLKEYGLKGCDVVIASLHIPCIKPGSIEQNTVDALVWGKVRQAGDDGLPTFYTAVSGFRMLLALATLVVCYFVVGRDAMMEYCLVFMGYYFAIMTHHSVFFARISNSHTLCDNENK